MPRSPNISPQTQAVLGDLQDQYPAWTHGYDLSRRTGLKSGTLYPLLRRLHEQGLLEARWEDSGTPGKPPRHIYLLSQQGVQALEEKQTARPARLPKGILT